MENPVNLIDSKGSPAGNVNTAELKSVGRTLLIVAASAVIAKLLVIVPGINFGGNSELITFVLIALLKAADKFVTDNSK
jgi:hypothetical protein